MPFIENPRAPGVKVEIAFDSGFATPEGSRTWTDVSADASGADGLTIGYGRTDQQSSADPNSLTLTLKNDTGKYTPGNASSPYFPNVKKGKPIRVTVTYAGTSYVRFTGYVNEWPVVWPDGSDRTSQVTITAASRRARLGQTAPLTSAIRAAYLATNPVAYWPMDEEYGSVAEFPDYLLFRDVSNLVDNPNARKREYISTFWDRPALQPVIHDGSPGPTDEASLVRFAPFYNFATYGIYAHYVGGGGVTRVNTAGEATVEVVARIKPQDNSQASVSVIRLLASDLNQRLFITVGAPAAVTCSLQILDPPTGNLLISMDGTNTYTSTGGSVPTGVTMPAQYAAAVDGDLHHYAVTLSAGGTVAKMYFDGVLVHTLTLPNPFAITAPLTGIAIGSDTYYATMWGGHAAVHNRALTAAEILAHAQAATAESETPDERVVRVAGRLGVPAGEVDAEVSIAAVVGTQGEAGRSAVEVLDELAASTGGVLYDTRTGHLAMQARNHRYNQGSTFTLNTASEELEVDLTAVLNDQYLVNSVELSRVGSDAPTVTLTDATSISDYGVYSKSLAIVSTSDEEVFAVGQDQLYRYATPRTRISQVSVDIGDLTSAQRDLVLKADVGTLFTIAGLPSQAPAPSMLLFVEGYAESVSTNGGHTITFNTTPGDLYANVMILDDPAHDRLDSGVSLAY